LASVPAVEVAHLARAHIGRSGVLVLLVIVALSNPFRGGNRISAEPFEPVLAHMEQE